MPKVAEHVSDLGALVKAETADHGVADVVAAQGLFHQARLRVGSVEHGAVRAPSGVLRFGGFRLLTQEGLDAVSDEEGFVFAVGRLVISNERARLAGRSIASCLCGGDCLPQQHRRLQESPASSGSSIRGE